MWQANIRTRTSLALVQINVHQKVKFIKAVLFYFFDYASLFPDWMALTWLSWMEFKKQNNWANQTRKKQPFKWFMKTKILVACEKSGWTLWQNLEWRLNFFQEFFDSFYVFLSYFLSVFDSYSRSCLESFICFSNFYYPALDFKFVSIYFALFWMMARFPLMLFDKILRNF